MQPCGLADLSVGRPWENNSFPSTACPFLHSARKSLYQLSSHRISCVSCQYDRMESAPSYQKSSRALWAQPAGTSKGFAAKKVPPTGCSCQKSAHMTTLTPAKARWLPSDIFIRAFNSHRGRDNPLERATQLRGHHAHLCKNMIGRSAVFSLKIILTSS